MIQGLNIAQDNVNGIKVLRITGYMDGHTFVDLEKCLDNLFKAGSIRIVIELSGMSYIASAGVGVFINGQYKARNSGGNLQLVNPSPNVREIFHILGMDSLFVIHETLEQGIKAAQV
jgi:anti-sigma B factor antagonist